MKLACISHSERTVIIWGLDQVEVVTEQIIRARKSDLKEHPNIANSTRDLWRVQIKEMEQSAAQAEELRTFLYKTPDC